jgi:hypothetical protein
VPDECDNCLTILRHTNNARAQMMGAGGAQPLAETALRHVAWLQQLHASFRALAALDPTAAEACGWALELFWPLTTVAAAARKAVAARERGEPDDALPVGTRVLINGLQAKTEFNCRDGEIHHRECIGGVERYAVRLDDEHPVLICVRTANLVPVSQSRRSTDGSHRRSVQRARSEALSARAAMPALAFQTGAPPVRLGYTWVELPPIAELCERWSLPENGRYDGSRGRIPPHWVLSAQREQFTAHPPALGELAATALGDTTYVLHRVTADTIVAQIVADAREHLQSKIRATLTARAARAAMDAEPI